MSQTEGPSPATDAKPVGHNGVRVEINERQALAVSGWVGVAIVLACIGVCIPIHSSGSPGFIAIPIVIAVLTAPSLMIVQPGDTKVVRFFGSYIGTIRRAGFWLVVPLADRRNLSV